MFASLEQNMYALTIYAVYVDKVLAIIYYHYNIIRWQQDVSYLLYYTKERANVIDEIQNRSTNHLLIFEGLREEKEIL
jgi:hypothetical protein